jgi:hypothetical protein
LEIGFIAEYVFWLDSTVEDAYIRDHLMELVKILRLLGKQIITTRSFRKQQDVINFDGEAFLFVFGEIVKLFRQALTDAGVDENWRHNIMLQFNDLLVMNEGRLRHETKALAR